MNLAQRAVRGTAWVLASSYTNMALGMGYGIIMARLLDPDHFGIFALAMFFFGLFDLRGKLGLDYTFIHRQPVSEALIATHWVLQTSAAAITLGVTLLAGIVMKWMGYQPSATGPVMVALAGAMLIEAAGTTARAGLEKELIFGRSTTVITGALCLSYLAAIGLALKGYTYWALVGQVMVNAAVSSVGFWWAYRHIGQRPSIRFSFDPEIARWMLRFGATLALGAVATLILLQFDNFLVGTFVSAAALGYYAQAYKVAQWPTGLVTHIIARVSLPTYAKLQADPSRLSKAFEMSLWLILLAALPLALAIFATAPDFLRLLYGDKWLPSAPLLRFLIGYSVLRPLLDDTGALFTAIGQPKRITLVLVAQAITLIVAATPLTLIYGAVGTAVGVGLAFVVGIALTYFFVSKTLPINLARLFWPAALAAGISLIIYFGLTHLVNLNPLPLWIRVPLKGGSIAALFLGTIWLLERHTFQEHLNYLRRLLIARG